MPIDLRILTVLVGMSRYVLLHRLQHLSLAFILAAFALTSVSAGEFGRLSASSTMGENGRIPTIAVDPSKGLTISMIRLPEKIQQVTLSRRNLVRLQFDSPLSSGASIIHVFPISKGGNFIFSIITIDASNMRRLYQIEANIKSSKILTVEIVPDALLQQFQSPPP